MSIAGAAGSTNAGESLICSCYVHLASRINLKETIYEKKVQPQIQLSVPDFNISVMYHNLQFTCNLPQSNRH